MSDPGEKHLPVVRHCESRAPEKGFSDRGTQVKFNHSTHQYRYTSVDIYLTTLLSKTKSNYLVSVAVFDCSYLYSEIKAKFCPFSILMKNFAVT